MHIQSENILMQFEEEEYERVNTLRSLKICDTEVGLEDGRLMELAQDCIEWWAVVLAVLNFRVCYQENRQPALSRPCHIE
jgi:hypothetical protein